MIIETALWACSGGLVISAIGLALSIAATASSAVIQNKQASNQERLAKSQFSFEKSQADAAAQQAAEAAAAERQSMAEEAARARGVAKTAGLGETSLRTFLTDISRKEGRANAIVDRNLELVASRQQANIQASQLSLSGKLLDIDSNRPNAAVVGLQIGTKTAAGGVDLYDRYTAFKEGR